MKNHDPILALDGGDDGLAAYKTIIKETKKLLSPGGTLLLEIGISQAPDIARLVEEAGFFISESYIDLGGVTRVLEIRSVDN